MIKPLPLRPGGTIAIVSPSSPQREAARLDAGIAYLRERGYVVVEAAHTRSQWGGYLAGTDAERAADFMWAMTSPGIDAVFCARGGYGSSRVLDMLDWQAIAGQRRLLVAFSDGTALQNALLATTGMVSIAGLLPSVDMVEPLDPTAEELFWRMVSSTEPIGRIPRTANAAMHGRGSANGTLLGGNLSVFTSLVGTPFLPPPDGGVLLAEDVAEAPYRVDRMLQQLRQSGYVTKLSGAVFGTFTEAAERPASVPSRTIDEVLDEFAGYIPGPVLMGIPHGHGRGRMALPIGLPCTVSTSDGGWIEFAESAVAH